MDRLCFRAALELPPAWLACMLVCVCVPECLFMSAGTRLIWTLFTRRLAHTALGHTGPNIPTYRHSFCHMHVSPS
jgi:hypothetical protein